MESMKAIDLNKLAKAITLKEGLKISLSIAQVKEVLKITMEELANEYPTSQVLLTIEQYVR